MKKDTIQTRKRKPKLSSSVQGCIQRNMDINAGDNLHTRPKLSKSLV